MLSVVWLCVVGYQAEVPDQGEERGDQWGSFAPGGGQSKDIVWPQTDGNLHCHCFSDIVHF